MKTLLDIINKTENGVYSVPQPAVMYTRDLSEIGPHGSEGKIIHLGFNYNVVTRCSSQSSLSRCVDLTKRKLVNDIAGPAVEKMYELEYAMLSSGVPVTLEVTEKLRLLREELTGE